MTGCNRKGGFACPLIKPCKRFPRTQLSDKRSSFAFTGGHGSVCCRVDESIMLHQHLERYLAIEFTVPLALAAEPSEVVQPASQLCIQAVSQQHNSYSIYAVLLPSCTTSVPRDPLLSGCPAGASSRSLSVSSPV